MAMFNCLLGHKASAPTGFRYFKFAFNNGGGVDSKLPEMRLLTAGYTLETRSGNNITLGTNNWPDQFLYGPTNNPPPYILTGGNPLAGLAGAWATFDGLVHSTVTYPASGAYIIIDMGQVLTVTALYLNTGTLTALDRMPSTFQLYASSTGAFAGEETLILSRSGVAWSTTYQGQAFTAP